MDGVTVLSTQEISGLGVWAAVAIVIVLVIGVLVAARCIIKGKYSIFLATIIVSLFAIALLCILGSKDLYTEYKVIIDDTVSYNDFVEKYEILDQENLIYTVKEREKASGR